MAETCIVCLGDLRTSLVDNDRSLSPSGVPATIEARRGDDDNVAAESGVKSSLRDTTLSTKSADSDDEIVAHLLPCKHNLHNACLKPWVERANSCPICRAIFNTVELSSHIGGEVIDSYAVQDKVQEPEIDPNIIIDDEYFEADILEPCLICGSIDNAHEVMYCDGCDKTVHVFCAGFEDSPEVWYCETCLIDMQCDTGLPGLRSALRRQPRQPTVASRRRGRNDASWARVWQEVSQRLDLDLDFPFDDEIVDNRTEDQRREFERWQRRFEVADRHGSARNLRRGIAARLQPPAIVSAPESQEELRAWNAFDKARELDEAPPVAQQKRKSSSSPPSPQEQQSTEQRQLKRPRLRRPPVPLDQQQIAESSHAAIQRAIDGPTFLTSLLREVAEKPISAGSPGATDHTNGQFSPRNSSPIGSPASSGYQTPRAHSLTPPPQHPISPPMSSSNSPPLSPTGLAFSPFSPTARSPGTRERNDPDRAENDEAQSPQMSSPSRGLSYSSKREIQRMVKLALGSRYQDKAITKDQYTDINRDVSRKMYDLVGDATALADHASREQWQRVADDEVRLAVATLSISSEADSPGF